MMQGKRSSRTHGPPAKTPLRWTGVLFAFAANVLLITVADMVVGWTATGLNLEWLATAVAPLAAGAATALYTRNRGAVHAFLGGLLSLPVLVLFVFPGYWQFGLFAAAFCTLGGAFTELALRRGNGSSAA
jgi:hypothetical protein